MKETSHRKDAPRAFSMSLNDLSILEREKEREERGKRNFPSRGFEADLNGPRHSWRWSTSSLLHVIHEHSRIVIGPRHILPAFNLQTRYSMTESTQQGVDA